MRKPDFGLLIGLLCLIALVPVTAAAQTGLYSPEPDHDFGSIGFDLEVFHNFPLVNGGNKPVHILSGNVTCDCSRLVILDSTLAPGDTAWVRLSFSTTDYYGPSNKTITIESDDPANSTLELHYRAQIGQWRYGIRPVPVSLFYLPGKKAQTSTILNPDLDFIRILNVEVLDSLVDVEVTNEKASKGKSLEMQVTPIENLPSGTYLTNYAVTVDVPQGLEPFVITIPVKIVRY